jgi:hypothetical protein
LTFPPQIIKWYQYFKSLNGTSNAQSCCQRETAAGWKPFSSNRYENPPWVKKSKVKVTKIKVKRQLKLFNRFHLSTYPFYL